MSPEIYMKHREVRGARNLPNLHVKEEEDLTSSVSIPDSREDGGGGALMAGGSGGLGHYH